MDVLASLEQWDVDQLERIAGRFAESAEATGNKRHQEIADAAWQTYDRKRKGSWK